MSRGVKGIPFGRLDRFEADKADIGNGLLGFSIRSGLRAIQFATKSWKQACVSWRSFVEKRNSR